MKKDLQILQLESAGVAKNAKPPNLSKRGLVESGGCPHLWLKKVASYGCNDYFRSLTPVDSIYPHIIAARRQPATTHRCGGGSGARSRVQ